MGKLTEEQAWEVYQKALELAEEAYREIPQPVGALYSQPDRVKARAAWQKIEGPAWEAYQKAIQQSVRAR